MSAQSATAWRSVPAGAGSPLLWSSTSARSLRSKRDAVVHTDPSHVRARATTCAQTRRLPMLAVAGMRHAATRLCVHRAPLEGRQGFGRGASGSAVGPGLARAVTTTALAASPPQTRSATTTTTAAANRGDPLDTQFPVRGGEVAAANHKPDAVVVFCLKPRGLRGDPMRLKFVDGAGQDWRPAATSPGGASTGGLAVYPLLLLESEVRGSRRTSLAT